MRKMFNSELVSALISWTCVAGLVMEVGALAAVGNVLTVPALELPGGELFVSLRLKHGKSPTGVDLRKQHEDGCLSKSSPSVLMFLLVCTACL